jgi:hypothetical protein
MAAPLDTKALSFSSLTVIRKCELGPAATVVGHRETDVLELLGGGHSPTGFRSTAPNASRSQVGVKDFGGVTEGPKWRKGLLLQRGTSISYQ